MFTYTTTITLRATDATGVLYFADQFRLSLETWEAYLVSKGFSLGEILEKSSFLMPIVHAEGDYFSPLFVSDRVEIVLEVERVGAKSFTLNYTFYKEGKKVGAVSIVHVCVKRATRTSINIPEELKQILQSLSDKTCSISTLQTPEMQGTVLES